MLPSYLPAAKCREIHADDAVPARGPLFRSGLEAVEPIRDPHVGKSGLRERRDQLCFQQSAGDSTGPEIDILARVLRQLDAEHDVRDLYSASRFQDTLDLGDGGSLLGH